MHHEKQSPEGTNRAIAPDDGFEAYREARRRGLACDSAASKRVKRKADAIIMPLLGLAYALQFLDRSSLSYASIMGMPKDLHLRDQDYSWLGSAFFISYLVAEIPSGRILQAFPLGKCMGTCAILWGICCAAFASVQGFREALALRILLGLFEACISPALILVVSQWYRKDEQSLRTGIWVSFNGFAQIFGSIVAYGFAKAGGTSHFGLAPWRIIFVFNGCLSIMVGILLMIFVPKNPLHAWWLSTDERLIAVARVHSNNQGIGTSKFKLYQIREALTDPFVIGVLLLATMGDIPNGGLANYFSQIIVGFGYTPLESLLYGCPAGAVGAAGILAWGVLSHCLGHRLLWGFGAATISLIGVCVLMFLPPERRLGRLFGYYLTTIFPAALASVLSLISSNVAGHTKKSTVAALFYIGYCVGNIIGPQTFRADQAPRFKSGEITVLTMMAACALDLLCMYGYLTWRNKRAGGPTGSPNGGCVEATEFLDLTDRENPGFTYVV